MHPRSIDSKDRLGWKIPYTTANSKGVWFPAARISLQIDSKTYELAVGVFPHLSMDMLLGQDVPRFCKLLKEALEDEKISDEMDKQAPVPERVMVTTWWCQTTRPRPKSVREFPKRVMVTTWWCQTTRPRPKSVREFPKEGWSNDPCPGRRG